MKYNPRAEYNINEMKQHRRIEKQKEKSIKLLEWLLHDMQTEPVIVGAQALRKQYMQQLKEHFETYI